MNFDLAKIDTPAQHAAGASMDLLYNGAPTGWRVRLLGAQARAVKLWLLKDANEFRAAQFAKRRAAAAAGKALDEAVELVSEDDANFKLRSAAARIVGWDGIVFEGEAYPFSAENALQLVERHPPWADEILEFSSAMGNFTQAPSND